MRYLGDDEATQMRGIDLYQGTDGNLYEWVDGVDEWGEQGLSEPEGPVLSGLGALYQAPDGTLYQMQGLAEGEEEGGEQPAGGEPPTGEQQPAGEEPSMKAMSPGAQGRRKFPGRRPQRPGPGVRGGRPRKKGGFLKKLLPIGGWSEYRVKPTYEAWAWAGFNSMVSTNVGFSHKPKAARYSPSRCNAVAS